MTFKHLKEANESYGCHFKISGRYGFKMIGAGLCLLFHAVLPCFCTKTGSTVVNNASDFFRQREAKCQAEQNISQTSRSSADMAES